MEKIGNNDKKIETKKQAQSIRVNKLYSICSAVYMFAAVVIMFGAGIGGIENLAVAFSCPSVMS